MSDQLPLFGPPPGNAEEPSPAAAKATGLVEPLVSTEDRELAERLPRFVRFGTSSWSFPGWKGLLWKGAPTEAELVRGGLEAYAQHPLFRAVGLDRSYYAPLRVGDLEGYRAQLESARNLAPTLPPFRIVSKVWDELTTAVFPSHPRYGARAGERNPTFLDPRRFHEDVLAPFVANGRPPPHGPFVFELTPMPRGTFDERALVLRVERFIQALPQGPRWAFELRNAELFGPRWRAMLEANGAGHVFTYWTAMPSLRMQLKARPLSPRVPFTLVRLMLPPFTRYADRKAVFAPFDRLAEPQPEMRGDVVDLLRAAAEAGSEEGIVVVNNKAEGSAPLTIRELARQTALAFGR